MQVHFGTVVTTAHFFIRRRVLRRLAWRGQVTVQADFVNERVALVHFNPHTHATFGLAQQGLHAHALAAQLHGRFFQCRCDVFVHEALHHRLGRLQLLGGQTLAEETTTTTRRQLRLFQLHLGVLTHCFVQAKHKQNQHHRERQPRQHHHGLHRRKVTGKQQTNGHQSDHDRPEDTQPVRGIFVHITALARQVGHHHRARIRRGQEQHKTDKDRHANHDFRRRVMLKQLVDRHRRLFQRRLAQLHRTVVNHQIQCRVTEDRQPGQGKAQRDQQHPSHQLTHGTATGNTRNEHAYEWGPGNPPRPVEQGPQTQPAFGFLGVAFVHVQVEGFHDDTVEVIAGVLHKAVEQVQGGAKQQHENQQATEQHDVQVGQATDAVFNARNGSDGGHGAHHDDDDQQIGIAVFHTEQVFQPGRHLHRANPQVGHQAEQGHEHAETIHRMARSAFHPTLAHQGVQRRTQRQRLVMTVGKIGHGQTDQRVNRPAVQAPMQERQLQRLTRGFMAARHAFWRVEVVVQRLGRAEIQQRDADTRREQHPGPRAIAEVRGVLLGPQFQFAVRRKRQTDHKDQVRGNHHHVVPAKGARQPLLGNAQQAAGFLWRGNQNGSQQQDQGSGGVKHPTVDRHLLRWGLYKRSRTHCTDAPGSAREELDAKQHPTKRLDSDQRSSDIKAPQKNWTRSYVQPTHRVQA